MKPVILDDERYVIQIDPSGVIITPKHVLGHLPGETYILDAAFFTSISETFREQVHKVQVFSNHEALSIAMSLLHSPSALHTPKFVEVFVADGNNTTGQSYIQISCSCGKIHTIRTQGDLDNYQSSWHKPVMEGI